MAARPMLRVPWWHGGAHMMFPKPDGPAQSDRRKEQVAQYRDLRFDFLCVKPWCKPCKDEGRRTRATEVHHKRGRGKHYLNIDTWLETCTSCHRRIEANPEWARERGYTESRHDPIEEAP